MADDMPKVPEDIREIARDGRLVAAIKAYRDRFGHYPLRDIKRLIDPFGLSDEQHPELMRWAMSDQTADILMRALNDAIEWRQQPGQVFAGPNEKWDRMIVPVDEYEHVKGLLREVLRRHGREASDG